MYIKYVVEIPSGVDLYCKVRGKDEWNLFIQRAVEEAKLVAQQTGGGEWMLVMRVKPDNPMFVSEIFICCDKIEDMSDEYLDIAGHAIVEMVEVDEKEFHKMTNNGEKRIFPIYPSIERKDDENQRDDKADL